MAAEIERKFLVRSLDWMVGVTKTERILQGYLSTSPTIRVRLLDNQLAKLTVKGENNGIMREEYEFDIPYYEASRIIKMCPRILTKVRHTIPYEHGPLMWEVDVFHEEGKVVLVMAEIELPTKDFELTLPGWIGEEVSDDPRYYNSNISLNGVPR